MPIIIPLFLKHIALETRVYSVFLLWKGKKHGSVQREGQSIDYISLDRLKDSKETSATTKLSNQPNVAVLLSPIIKKKTTPGNFIIKKTRHLNFTFFLSRKNET